MPSLNQKSKIQNPKFSDARPAVLIGAFALLLTCVPYLAGYFAVGRSHFLWLGANIDDDANYLAWMRQGASGSLRLYNRFTTDPQPGLFANPLFLLLGLFARVMRLPLVAVYHLARIGFGAGLLLLVWKFIRLTIADRRARLLSFTFVCFASGLGWLPFVWENLPTRATCPAGPIDLWHPEAITFLSLYLNPLFLCAMCLQIAIFTLLLKAEREGGRKGMKCALSAGICGLILALVHTYDILTVAAVWTAYLALLALARSSAILSSLARASVAGLLTLPGVLLMASQLKTNKVFNARANVETLTAYPQSLLLGYGLTLALACYALLKLWRNAKMTAPNPNEIPHSPNTPDALINGTDALQLLTVWPVVNLLIAYLPGLAFQRKLLQGEHFPIAILAGIGAAHLIAKYQPIQTRQEADAELIQNPKSKIQNRADPKFKIQNGTRFAIAASLLTLLLGMTNLKFLLDETERFQNHETKIIARPSLLPGEIEALNWIAANTPAGAAVQPIPWQTIDLQAGKRGIYDMTLALFTPALANRAVYCGHFGETPDYVTKLNQDLGRVALGNLPENQRVAILRRMKVQYLLFSQKDPQDAPADILFPQFRQHRPLPPCLTLVHSNPDADIYFIKLP